MAMQNACADEMCRPKASRQSLGVDKTVWCADFVGVLSEPMLKAALIKITRAWPKCQPVEGRRVEASRRWRLLTQPGMTTPTTGSPLVMTRPSFLFLFH